VKERSTATFEECTPLRLLSLRDFFHQRILLSLPLSRSSHRREHDDPRREGPDRWTYDRWETTIEGHRFVRIEIRVLNCLPSASMLGWMAALGHHHSRMGGTFMTQASNTHLGKHRIHKSRGHMCCTSPTIVGVHCMIIHPCWIRSHLCRIRLLECRHLN